MQGVELSIIYLSVLLEVTSVIMLNFLSSFRISIFLFISFVVFWICWDTSKEPSRLISLCGLVVYIFFGFLFSKHRDQVRDPSEA